MRGILKERQRLRKRCRSWAQIRKNADEGMIFAFTAITRLARGERKDSIPGFVLLGALDSAVGLGVGLCGFGFLGSEDSFACCWRVILSFPMSTTLALMPLHNDTRRNALVFLEDILE